MDSFVNIVIGTLQIAPEIEVLVRLIGVLYLLEVITSAIAFIGGVRR